MHFKDDSKFISYTLRKPLAEESWTLTNRLRKQVKDEPITYAMASGSKSLEKLLNSQLIFSFVLNIFVASSFQLILAIVNTLQLVMHLPIMSIVFPGNIMTFFEILIPVVMFDLLENFEVIQQLFPDSSGDAEKLQGIINQMSDIGYDSYNPLLNLGTIGLFLGLYFVKLFIFGFLVYPLSKVTGLFKRQVRKLKHQLFFSDLILLFLEGYMEFLISS